MNLYRQLVFILIGLTLLLLPFLWISFYVHPSADDFAYAWSTKFVGYWASNLRDFFNWNGRYFSNLLVFLNPLSKDSFIGYQLIPLFLILLSLLAVQAFLNLAFNQSNSTKISWAFSLLFVLLYLSAMPQLAQGIYWYTGAITYQTGILFSMLIIGLQMHSLKHESMRLGLKLLIGCFIFCAVGCSETTMFHLLLFQLFIFYKTKRRGDFELLIFSLLCASLVLFSPGNAIRAAQFSDGGKLGHSFLSSVFQTLRFSITWLSFLPVFIASFIAIPFFAKAKQAGCHLPLKIRSVELLVLIFLVLFMSSFPSYWATGILGQHRTMNAACWWFLLLWFLFLFQIVNTYMSESILQQFSSLLERRFRWIALCLVISFFIKGNFRSVANDLVNGRARNFDAQLDQRYLKMKDEKGKDCVVDSLNNLPASIFCFELSADSSYWINRGEAAYFELKSVRLKNR